LFGPTKKVIFLLKGISVSSINERKLENFIGCIKGIFILVDDFH
jgi:hypothetical protein